MFVIGKNTYLARNVVFINGTNRFMRLRENIVYLLVCLLPT